LENLIPESSFPLLKYLLPPEELDISPGTNEKMLSKSTFALTSLLAFRTCTTLSIPSNIQSLYSSIVAAGSCSNILQTGFEAEDGGPNSKRSSLLPIIRTNSAAFSYCGDHLDDYGIIYLQGVGGALADMDVDCDGLQGGVGDDGRCGSSEDTQSQTAFEDTVVGYNVGLTELNSFIHMYVVFGNQGTLSGYVNFDPTAYGVQPLSVMAVVCSGQMVCSPLVNVLPIPDGPNSSTVFGETLTEMMIRTLSLARPPSQWRQPVSELA
jgi:hypothetical protein